MGKTLAIVFVVYLCLITLQTYHYHNLFRYHYDRSEKYIDNHKLDSAIIESKTEQLLIDSEGYLIPIYPFNQL